MNRANARVKKKRKGDKKEKNLKERERDKKEREGSIEAWQGRRESGCWNEGWKRVADDVFQRFPPLDTFGSPLKELVRRGREGKGRDGRLRRWQRGEKLRFRSWHRRHSSSALVSRLVFYASDGARWPQEFNPSTAHFRIFTSHSRKKRPIPAVRVPPLVARFFFWSHGFFCS